jgi:hypothetical protein
MVFQVVEMPEHNAASDDGLVDDGMTERKTTKGVINRIKALTQINLRTFVIIGTPGRIAHDPIDPSVLMRTNEEVARKTAKRCITDGEAEYLLGYNYSNDADRVCRCRCCHRHHRHHLI